MKKLVPDLPLAEAPVPVVKKRGRPKGSRTVRRNACGTARDAIGPVEPGCEIFCLTNGQFSIVDVLDYLLSVTGPASLDLATWTASDGDLRRAHSFLLSRRITRCRFVVDPSFKTRKPEFCAVLTDLFGDDAIRTTPLHGKFACIRNDGWNLAIRSSMNLNVNRRIESVEISDDPGLADCLTEFVDEVYARAAKPDWTRQSASMNARQDIGSRLCF